MTATSRQTGGACATTSPAFMQVSGSRRGQVAHGGAFPTYRRNRAHAHARMRQPICQDTSNAPPATIPAWPTGGLR